MPSSKNNERKEFMSKKYGNYWKNARGKYRQNEYHYNYLRFIQHNVKTGSQILDVRIGTGEPFADTFDKNRYQVFGIDISMDLINECKKINKNLKCSVGDAENINFADNFFDSTYCFASTWYIPDLYKCIDEMLRVTKTDGLLLFDIQNINNIIVRQNYLKRIKDKSGFYVIKNYIKNIFKLILRRGLVDWSNIIYDIPSNPIEILNHLQKKDIQMIKVYDANNNLKECDINDLQNEKSGCLLFVINL